ncbi:MAG: nucleotidyltransferase domain-containing protein [Sedimentisphaerales bacterium]|nr:nucleotidyltransferase domain-containing protein [Sedimentisphaerales bacterium]
MPLSKHYIDMQDEPVPLAAAAIADLLEGDFPQISFAVVLGSAAQGTVGPHSDLDLAVFCTQGLSLDERLALIRGVEELHQGVRCDLGFLNLAEPVFRFEALKGRLILKRDEETWRRFYSTTCREYETQIFHYDKQRRYRLRAQRQARRDE